MFRKDINKVVADNVEMRKVKSMDPLQQALYQFGTPFEGYSMNMDRWFLAMRIAFNVKTKKRKVRNRS